MSTEDKTVRDDLLDALAKADVLDGFCRLPEVSRRQFEQWIGRARDSEAHWRRIDTLVMAMRMSPRLVAQTDETPESEAHG